jgi:hypothetical protein
VNSQVALALIASLTSLAVAIAGIPLNYLIGKRLRREQDLDMMSHYRDPLLQAAADLRSRLVTILAEDFLGRFLIGGKETQKVYAVKLREVGGFLAETGKDFAAEVVAKVIAHQTGAA